MRRSEREATRRRYQFRCGYCGTSETDAGGELTIDHFQPRAHGGSDVAENLVYACIACNDFKGDYWTPDSPRHSSWIVASVHLTRTPETQAE